MRVAALLTNGTSTGVDLNSAALIEYVCTLNILEARQLAGHDIDPYVQVQIGTQVKRTVTMRNTVEPQYNEVRARG
jgi:Ca2+-dependent lipid-binding protein